MNINNVSKALKQAYADYLDSKFSHFAYGVPGAKEELLLRIKELSLVEKTLYGISEDGEYLNE